MRPYKTSIVAAIILAIAGCTTNHGSTFHERYMRSTYGENEAMYPNPSDCMDPVEFLQAYVKADHKKVVAPLDALAETLLWDMEDGVEHVTMTVSEYLPHDSTRSSGQMLLAMYDVCSKNAGRMSGHWCFK